MAITKINTPELFDLGTTNSSLRLPSGDTASRPSNPNTGEWRYNTDDNYVEYWDSTAWFQIDYETAVVPCTTNTINYPTAVTAYYKMEDATDQTGNYNGTPTNVNFNVAGKFGNAGEFNGSSSYIETPSIIPANNFSFSCWINMNSLPASNAYQLIYNTNVDRKWYVSIFDGGKIEVWNGVTEFTTTSNVVTTNQWYHIAYTADGTNGKKIYVDGAEVFTTSDTVSNSVPSTGNAWKGFGKFFLNTLYFDGKIDQVRIFPSAISAANVTSLYNEVQCAPTIVPSEHFNVNTYVGNGATQVIDAKFNEAAVFNGSSSRIAISQGSFDISTMSLGCWFNTSNTSQNYQTIFNNYSQTAGEDRGWYVRYETGGNIRLRGFSSSNSQVLDALISTTINQNEWYHIAITITSTEVKIYKNGSQIGTTQSLSSPIGYSTYPGLPTIGAYRSAISTYANYFNGKIDQVRIYNTALTQQQVTDLYTNETTATAQLLDFPVGAGCIAAYELDGDASDVGKTYGGIPTDIGYTGMQFAPDLVWLKNRDSAYSHRIFDSVRGADKTISSDTADAEYDGGGTGYMSSFDSNGFTLSSGNANTNGNGTDYVAWNWKSGGAPTTTNSAGAGNVPTAGSVKIDGADSTTALAGTIAATSISANTDAGFSIVKYTGNSTAGATVGHGLTDAEMIILKDLTDGTNNWRVWHKDLTANYWMYLNLSLGQANAATDGGIRNVDANTFGFINGTTEGVEGVNSNASDYIAYCFHSVEGFSKIGSYIGTGASGNTIVTGFEPAFVMVKRTDGTGVWVMLDNKRNLTNPRNSSLYANTPALEDTGSTSGFYPINFYSNGFEPIQNTGDYNASGGSYIFIAFAAAPAPEPVLANSFDISLYTGNGGTQSVTGVGFQPDLIWGKQRNGSLQPHVLVDSVRGRERSLASNLTNAENNYDGYNPPVYLSSFDNNGFTLGYGTGLNQSGINMVAWCWKAAEIPAINSNGTITSLVNANPAAGFSIVKYTGNSTAGATVGHGLSSVPQMIIVKRLSTPIDNWAVYNETIGNTKRLALDESGAATPSGRLEWNSTTPTSTVFTLGNHSAVNQNSSYIAYCFHSVVGYQKVGSYNGTGTSLNQINVGFAPRFVMIKRTNSTGGWRMYDNVRGLDKSIQAQIPDAEYDDTTNYLDFYANGFEFNNGVSYQSNPDINASAGTYIYLAIA